MLRLIAWLGFAYILLNTYNAHAEVTLEQAEDASCTMRVSGEVNVQLYNDVRLYFIRSAVYHCNGVKVVLRSPGGFVAYGMAIYDEIRRNGADTHVDEYCASACTFIFLAGKHRSMSDKAVLLFHSPYYWESETVFVCTNDIWLDMIYRWELPEATWRYVRHMTYANCGPSAMWSVGKIKATILGMTR